MLNLHEYWFERGIVYDPHDSDEKGQIMLSDAINELKPKRLIDIGCGTGPMFQYYQGIDVTAIDWSVTMLTKARQRIRENGYDIKTLSCDISGDELPPGHFDCAVTRTCLMHIPPGRIEKAIQNIRRLSDQALIVEYWEATEKPMAQHNWRHDYKKLFEKCGFGVITSSVREDIPHIFLHVRA